MPFVPPQALVGGVCCNGGWGTCRRRLLGGTGTAARSCTNSGWNSEQREEGRATGDACVIVFSSGLGCWSGNWHWGASHSGSGGLWLCTHLGATRTLSHSSPSLPCFTVLQCVLLLGLTHLPHSLSPPWSAAGFPADFTLPLPHHPPSAPSAAPTSARPSAAGGLPLPRTDSLAGARDFSC